MSVSDSEAVAVITGAAAGIGQAIALAFAERGVSIALLDLASLDETSIAATRHGVDVVSVQGDVSDSAQVAKFFATVDAKYGRLDYAVNAAGIQQPTLGPTADVSDADWAKTMAVNLNGVFYCTRAEIRLMLATGEGSIVNIGSNGSVQALPNIPAYTAAKHAVAGLTKAAGVEYAARGVRVNAVLPGATDTQMIRGTGSSDEIGRALNERVLAAHPIGRMGLPHEIAAVAMFLCSPASSFMTGALVSVDGGNTAV